MLWWCCIGSSLYASKGSGCVQGFTILGNKGWGVQRWDQATLCERESMIILLKVTSDYFKETNRWETDTRSPRNSMYRGGKEGESCKLCFLRGSDLGGEKRGEDRACSLNSVHEFFIYRYCMFLFTSVYYLHFIPYSLPLIPYSLPTIPYSLPYWMGPKQGMELEPSTEWVLLTGVCSCLITTASWPFLFR